MTCKVRPLIKIRSKMKCKIRPDIEACKMRPYLEACKIRPYIEACKIRPYIEELCKVRHYTKNHFKYALGSRHLEKALISTTMKDTSSCQEPWKIRPYNKNHGQSPRVKTPMMIQQRHVQQFINHRDQKCQG